MKDIFKNKKTSAAGIALIVLTILFALDCISQEKFMLVISILAGMGLISSADGGVKQGGLKVILVFSVCSFIFWSCSFTNYKYTKYSVLVGASVAEDAGLFEPHEFTIPNKFTGDTIFYYKGINSYLIQKTDTLYRIRVVPSKENVVDTSLYYLRKLHYDKKKL